MTHDSKPGGQRSKTTSSHRFGGQKSEMKEQGCAPFEDSRAESISGSPRRPVAPGFLWFEARALRSLCFHLCVKAPRAFL